MKDNSEIDSAFPSLRWQTEDDEPRLYYLSKPEVTIGRHPTSDICLNSAAVSRLHAIISLRRVRFYIEDQQSKLGTFLNGQLINKAELLSHGQLIGIGPVIFTFYDPMATLEESEFNLPDYRAGLVINLQTGQVLLNSLPVALSPKEYGLLAFLYTNRERTCNRDEIRAAVWPERNGLEVSDLEIDALVSRLRRKIEPSPANPSYIVTVRALRGLRFEDKI
jgi:DNA-binding response OmpR family regulator